MSNITALIICIICSIAAFLMLGFNYFALYQLLPIVVFFIFQVTVFNRLQRSETFARICYIISFSILLMFPLFAQSMYYFDINQTASKSSTSGLLFVWLPIYAVLPGLVPCSIAWIIHSKRRKASF